MKSHNHGFTLIEVLTVLIIIFGIVVVGWVFAIKTVCQGNFWFQTDSALRELQASHQDVSKILTTQRNIFDKSVLLIENKNGSRKEYCLDTSVLFNYEFSECSEGK